MLQNRNPPKLQVSSSITSQKGTPIMTQVIHNILFTQITKITVNWVLKFPHCTDACWPLLTTVATEPLILAGAGDDLLILLSSSLSSSFCNVGNFLIFLIFSYFPRSQEGTHDLLISLPSLSLLSLKGGIQSQSYSEVIWILSLFDAIFTDPPASCPIRALQLLWVRDDTQCM